MSPQQDDLSSTEEVERDSTVGTEVRNRRSAKPQYPSAGVVQVVEQRRKKRRIDEDYDSDPLASARKRPHADESKAALVLSNDGESVGVNVMQGIPSASSSYHGSELTHYFSGRGSQDLSTGLDHVLDAALHNPMLQQGGSFQTLANFDPRLSMFGIDRLLTQRNRHAQIQGNAMLSGRLQPGMDMPFLSRGHAVPRELAHAGYLNSSRQPFEDPAMLEFLQRRHASLSANTTAMAHSRFHVGNEVGSPSVPVDRLLQYEISALLAGTTTNTTLLRLADEIDRGGISRTGGRFPIFAPHPYSGGQVSSLPELARLNSGGFPGSSLVGSGDNFGNTLANRHPAVLGLAQDAAFLDQIDPFAVWGRAALPQRLPAGAISESGRHAQAYTPISLTGGSSSSDSSVGFRRRTPNSNETAGISSIPTIQDSSLHHFTQRTCVPLATDEDENWLSEFLCFVRRELVEVFRASHDDVASRISSKKVVYGQVGIRCRYCAHLPHNDRASRSSSFPSSIGRIYQSLTMMIRDHFILCLGLPEASKSRFLELKARTTQGATDSKRYWIESATRLGMVDTPGQGIWIDEAMQSGAFSTSSSDVEGRSDCSPAESFGAEKERMVVQNDDKPFVSEYIYFLMTQVERVNLTESERVGNRRIMELGMPGFGCRHCCASGRKGLCRFFPARRRTLPAKIKDLSDHIRRCTMCPMEVKETLADFKRRNLDEEPTEGANKHFFDRVWARLHSGRSVEPEPNSGDVAEN